MTQDKSALLLAQLHILKALPSVKVWKIHRVPNVGDIKNHLKPYKNTRKTKIKSKKSKVTCVNRLTVSF